MTRTVATLVMALLLATPAMAHESTFEAVGPPAPGPAATVMATQVRIVQEGPYLRVLVDVMSGDNVVQVLRPSDPDAEPLLVDAGLQ